MFQSVEDRTQTAATSSLRYHGPSDNPPQIDSRSGRLTPQLGRCCGPNGEGCSVTNNLGDVAKSSISHYKGGHKSALACGFAPSSGLTHSCAKPVDKSIARIPPRSVPTPCVLTLKIPLTLATRVSRAVLYGSLASVCLAVSAKHETVLSCPKRVEQTRKTATSNTD